jgi:DNA polymerase-3 subunit alpha
MVEDITTYARSIGGRWACGPGRGSASGSVICYLIGITDVDPIKHMLRVEVNPPCSKYFARLLENE